jgi:hypothetical protein
MILHPRSLPKSVLFLIATQLPPSRNENAEFATNHWDSSESATPRTWLIGIRTFDFKQAVNQVSHFHTHSPFAELKFWNLFATIFICATEFHSA